MSNQNNSKPKWWKYLWIGFVIFIVIMGFNLASYEEGIIGDLTEIFWIFIGLMCLFPAFT